MNDPFISETAALMQVAKRPPVVFESGEGSWIFDRDGKRYLDFVQGWAVNCLGHCPKEIREALNTQAARLISPSPTFYNQPSIELAATLAKHSVFDRVFFCSTGAEANEGAIKLARKWGQKYRDGAHEIITFQNGFHGRSLATMSASGKPGWDTLFAPQVPGFPKAILNDIASVEALANSRTVAVMLEPVQGEAGVIAATNEFMRDLRRFTEERGLLLIVDEVQTGMGRTGKLFAYEHSGITPDIMTLGKGIGGGVPLAALLARESICCFEPGDQGGTYTGNPLMAAVGLAVTNALLAPGFLDSVKEKGEYLAAKLTQIAARHGLPAERGSGLLRALVLDRPIAEQIVNEARALSPEGLLINTPRPTLLRFMPSLRVSYAEIDLMLERLEAAIARVVLSS